MFAPLRDEAVMCDFSRTKLSSFYHFISGQPDYIFDLTVVINRVNSNLPLSPLYQRSCTSLYRNHIELRHQFLASTSYDHQANVLFKRLFGVSICTIAQPAGVTGKTCASAFRFSQNADFFNRLSARHLHQSFFQEFNSGITLEALPRSFIT